MLKPMGKKPELRKTTQTDDGAPGQSDASEGAVEEHREKPRRRKRPSAEPRGVSDAAESKGVVSAADFLQLPNPKENISIELPGGEVEVSNLDKVFWPDEEYTKADLIGYYLQVSDTIINYLKDRPAILARYPNGIADSGFFQQNIKDAPAILETERLQNQVGRFLNYAVYTSVASLIYLVNLGTIAQNPWHSRLSNLDRPDYIVFDLDPHGSPFANVLQVALVLRDVLSELRLTGYPKTSGSTGVHVYVPIARRYDYQEVARFSEQVSTRVAERVPKLATVERRISGRKQGQVYVDWQQNTRGKSAASVYSVRAKPGASVSMPVTWDEVSQGFEIADFTIRTVPGRLKKKGDLWADFLKDNQALPKLPGEH